MRSSRSRIWAPPASPPRRSRWRRKGGLGIELDLDRVPMRETGMTPYEIMLSRKPGAHADGAEAGREAQARAVFEKWELDFAVIGRITDTGRLVVRACAARRRRTCRSAPLVAAAPDYDRPRAAMPPPPLPDSPARCRRRTTRSRRCSGCSAAPTSPAGAGSGSSTTTWCGADTCSGRAATPPCVARPRHAQGAGR